VGTGERQDPLVSFHFYVTIGPLEGAFRECSGLGSESQIVEYKAAGSKGQEVVIKQPGALKWENIVLKRGITKDLKLWEWRKQVEDGDVVGARRDGSVFMYDQKGTLVASWHFRQGWPSGLSGPQLNAAANEVAVETLTIAHEGIYRET
jgi:phage tail-like protein